MQAVFGFLAAVISIYSILIFIRIVISWFGGMVSSKPVELLCRVTDPYLDWWRRTFNFRLGFIDLSPLLGIVALSVLQNIIFRLSHIGRITLGNILAIIIVSLWGITSFLLGFCVIVLILRMIAFLTNRDMYTPLWKMADSISQPILYKITKIIYGDRSVHFTKGIVISVVIMTLLWIGGRILVPLLANFLYSLPL